MTILDPLAEFQRIVSRLRQHGWSNEVFVEECASELLNVAAVAKNTDPSVVYLCASLLNLLVDLTNRKEIVDTDAMRFLTELETSPETHFLRPTDGSLSNLVLLGTAIECSHDLWPQLLCGICSWPKFCSHYAAVVFGRSSYSLSDTDQLWKQTATDGLDLPDEEVLFLDGWNHCVWVTDMKMLNSACSDENANLNASAAYDLLGLDWTEWEHIDANEWATCRAVLISRSLSICINAIGGMHTPTAIDAWGHMLFSPGVGEADTGWRGGLTEHATNNKVHGLPEAIHGPISVPGKRSVSVVGVVGQPSRGNRLAQLGLDVLERRHNQVNSGASA